MNILFRYFIYLQIIFVAFLWSVSAPPFPFEVIQSDGTKIPVRMFGHEYYNWVEIVDGYVINWVEDETRFGWYYSTLDENGKYMASEIQAVYPTPLDLNIPKHLKEIDPQVRVIHHVPVRDGINHLSNLERSILISTIKPLVLLVDFKDKFEKKYTVQNFNSLIFDDDLEIGEIPSAEYSMSVNEYYDEISNSMLNIHGNNESIVDWTTVEHNYNYYVDGKQGTGQGCGYDGTINIAQTAAALVVEIAMEIEDSLDFSQFDGNEDGAVDVVILVIEGKGGPGCHHFWPHMSYIQATSTEECSGICAIDSNAPLIDNYFGLDGVVINKYIVIMEQYNEALDPNHGIFSGDIHPIGTLCHELGHVLGLPDLYDTSENSAAGIGEWGLMGSGNWNSQKSPAYMSAWSRYRLGFIEPLVRDIIDSEEIILPAESGEKQLTAIILPMDSNMPKEYLILENRQPINSDVELKEPGLLVWHIDETITDMYPAMNSVNVNPDYYGVNLIQADGLQELNTCTHSYCADRGDPYPGIEGIDKLPNHITPFISTYSYDRDADGNKDYGRNCNIELSEIIDYGDHIRFRLTNPNKNGNVVAYDEGHYDGHSILNINDLWVGILFSPDTSAVLSSIQTIFPPSIWPTWNVTDYIIQIWEGWNNDKPGKLLNILSGVVNWGSGNGLRDGGWVSISYLDEHIVLVNNKEYYVEIKYNGTGGIYPFDKSEYSHSNTSGMSYYRGNHNKSCTKFEHGDWNIRVGLSGQNCGDISEKQIWPGDMDGDFDVDADDIIPLGVYYGSYGCHRRGDDYKWEAQPYPDGWEDINAARADANGDGLVNISDLLVILVNWGKTTSGLVITDNGEQTDNLNSDNLQYYRNNFYQLYENMSGRSEPEALIRAKLEELFGFIPIPKEYILKQNFPNPFNSFTTISYFHPGADNIDLVVYNMRGRIVDYFNQTNLQKGWHKVVFNADKMSSGIYFYRLINDDNIISQKKMLLLK